MEATKERAARCNRATPARTSGSSPAHGSRTKSIAHRRRRAKTRIRQAAVLLTADTVKETEFSDYTLAACEAVMAARGH